MPVCDGCGGSYNEEFQFCPFCGRAKSAPEITRIEIVTKKQSSKIDCPICHSDDFIRSVSAIVDSETVRSETKVIEESKIYSKEKWVGKKEIGTAKSTGTLSSIQRSELAKKLEFDNAPMAPQMPALWCSQYFFLLIAIIVILILIIIKIDRFALLGTVLIFSVVLFGWFFKISTSNYQEQLRIFTEDMEKYNYMRNRWKNSYYCSRDNVVFVLGEKEVEAPPVENLYAQGFQIKKAN